MPPMGEVGWPESLRPLYEGISETPATEALAASARWREAFAQWVKGASLEERIQAELAAWDRLDSGERTAGELLFLLSSCVELLWPYASPPTGLLRRLLARRESMLGALEATGDSEGVKRVRRETEAVISTVLARYLKRHPESLLAMVEDTPCTFDGRALRFEGAVEVDLKQALGAGAKSIGLLEQLRALLPRTPVDGRDKLADFIRSQAARIPWREASEALAERLFALATSPEGRSGMSGFLACYPSGRREPEWCARAGLLLSRTLEAGGPPEVVENLCELLARFDAPPVDGLRGALGALVAGDFETMADVGPVRFVLNHCQATLRKGEPGLVLTLLWLEERLFRASVKKGLPDAFERRVRVRTKLQPWASEFRSLCWLAEECSELWPRITASTRPGMDELAAWRQEVAARVGRKPVLRKAAIEFFLWCAPDAAASEAELTVLSLVRTATDRRQVRRLKEHPSSRVRFRVRTLQAWLQGSGKSGAAPAVEPTGSSGPATVTEALRHLHVTRAVPLGGRTWLRDRDLEELLLGAVGRVEAEFATRYPERFREDTAELVAGLLDGLRVELERVQSDMSALLAPGQSAPLEIGFTVRRVPPGSEEEGEPEPQGELFAPEAVTVEKETGIAASDIRPASSSVDASNIDLAAASIPSDAPVDSAGADAAVVEPETVALDFGQESSESRDAARPQSTSGAVLTEVETGVIDSDTVEPSAGGAAAVAPESDAAASVVGPTTSEPLEAAAVAVAPGTDAAGADLGPTSSGPLNVAVEPSDAGTLAGAPEPQAAASVTDSTSSETLNVSVEPSSSDAVAVAPETEATASAFGPAPSEPQSTSVEPSTADAAAIAPETEVAALAIDPTSSERVTGSVEPADLGAMAGEPETEVAASAIDPPSSALVDAVVASPSSGVADVAPEADDTASHIALDSSEPMADAVEPAASDTVVPDSQPTEVVAPEPGPVSAVPLEVTVMASADPAMAPPLPDDLTASDSGELKVRPPSAPMEVRATSDAARPASTRPLGVEVAFVLTVDVDGFMRTERAALARVVKLEQRGEGQWMPTFRLAREPLDALLLRSEAAFCLFLAPPIPRPECWMVPARVARGLMETQRSLSGVPREGVQRVARSLSQWLVGELVGLWTGDERPELLEQLRAGKGGPEFIVELRLVGRTSRH
ncbi:hypothetical protein [Pyxidicoccus fallax]|uniref:hypothetical protein n=1 Tax=Pyxidicoccus fallax TaxID=394095 RepID=UPI001FE7F0D3|nr:hypothetical protein [Pyxidicoccus fallax]